MPSEKTPATWGLIATPLCLGIGRGGFLFINATTGTPTGKLSTSLSFLLNEERFSRQIKVDNKEKIHIPLYRVERLAFLVLSVRLKNVATGNEVLPNTMRSSETRLNYGCFKYLAFTDYRLCGFVVFRQSAPFRYAVARFRHQ